MIGTVFEFNILTFFLKPCDISSNFFHIYLLLLLFYNIFPVIELSAHCAISNFPLFPATMHFRILEANLIFPFVLNHFP